jgi:hypothetical protein
MRKEAEVVKVKFSPGMSSLAGLITNRVCTFTRIIANQLCTIASLIM